MPVNQRVPMTDPARITTEAIDEIERLEREATAGPWNECGHDRGGCQCGMVWSPDLVVAVTSRHDEDMPNPTIEAVKANAALIAALRNHAPALIRAAREAERMRAVYDAALDWAVDMPNGSEKRLRDEAMKAIQSDGQEALGPLVRALSKALAETEPTDG